MTDIMTRQMIADVPVGTLLSGAALIVIGAVAALAVSGIASRALVYRAIDK